MYARADQRLSKRGSSPAEEATTTRSAHYLTRASSILALAAAVQSGAIQPASAQEPGEGAETRQVDEVIVSGSRIIRDGVTAPTPVTVLDAADLRNSAPGNLPIALMQLPAFRGSTSVATTSISVSPGASSANLRGIGSQRTLTLLDGRRMAPAALAGGSDMNLIPLMLVKRIDVVTGGASAAYGSDAVSGVINFILDTDFRGIKGEVQGGVSDRGDKRNYQASLAAGTGFGGDRGHVIAAAEYYDDEGLMFPDRSLVMEGWSVITVPGVTAATASPTNPFRITAPNVRLSNASLGGLITSGPLAGTQFGPGGVPQPFSFGTHRTGLTMSGGDGPNPSEFGNLYAPLERKSAFTHVTYDVTSNLAVFAEGALSRSLVTVASYPNWQNGVMQLVIPSDNFFLPASIRDQMTALNLASFTMGRLSPDFGPMGGTGESESIRFVGGFKARFGDTWTSDAYYTRSEVTVESRTYYDSILTNLFRAADAVLDPASGAPICRSTLQDPTSTDPRIRDCVPINLFGAGSPSAEALNYVLGIEPDDVFIKQDVVAFSVNGNPFSTWAGPLGIAFGAEYRKEFAKQTSDDIAHSIVSNAGIPTMPASLNGKVGGYNLSNLQPNKGAFHVKEGFFETQVPLLNDVAWARSLDLNAAIRYADYSLSGGVTTWKTGLVYQPIDGLRLRATKSRDIRAANVAELFAPGAGTGLGITDPFRNNEQVLGGTTITTGNAELTPEKADTTALGVTYLPSWLPGFSASVDYYDIEIEDAIASLGAQNIVNQCFLGATHLCPLIRRGPDGIINAVTNPTLNAASLKASGMDIEASYGTPLSEIVSRWDGVATLRLLATYLGKLETTNLGATPIDRAGDIRNTGTPHWMATMTAGYAKGLLDLFLRGRYVGSGEYDTTFGPTAIDDNRIGSQFYTDLTTRIGLGAESRTEIFLTVNNVFDREPPQSGFFFVVGTQPIGKNLYDMVGRSYTMGVRFTL